MFDDVVELFEIATSRETYTNPSETAKKVERFVQNSGRQKLLENANEGAKRFAFVPLAYKGVDALVDRSGLDPDRAVRDRIGMTEQDVRTGGMVDLLDDEVSLVPSDTAPEAPAADRKVSGWFDP